MAPGPTTAGTGARLIVGLSGGIACYKVAQVVSRLVQAGHEVTCLMTESATRFVTPLTFQALSGRPVYTSVWEHIESHDPQHVALARDAALMLIAPATMDMLARLVHGRADDVVTLVAGAFDRSTGCGHRRPCRPRRSLSCGRRSSSSRRRCPGRHGTGRH